MFAYRYIMLVVRTPAVTGAWLAARRRELGLTQSEAGQRAGITRQSVSRIERGTVLPTLSRLLDFADSL